MKLWGRGLGCVHRAGTTPPPPAAAVAQADTHSASSPAPPRPLRIKTMPSVQPRVTDKQREKGSLSPRSTQCVGAACITQNRSHPGLLSAPLEAAASCPIQITPKHIQQHSWLPPPAAPGSWRLTTSTHLTLIHLTAHVQREAIQSCQHQLPGSRFPGISRLLHPSHTPPTLMHAGV